MRGVDRSAIGQSLQDEGSRREGGEASEEDGHRPAAHRGSCYERGDDDGEDDLYQSGNEGSAAHAAQLLQRELDADGEQQQDDAHLGERFHGVRVAHEPKAVGAHEQTGDDEPGKGGQAQAVEDQHDHHRDRENDRQVGEDGDLVHRPPPP